MLQGEERIRGNTQRSAMKLRHYGVAKPVLQRLPVKAEHQSSRRGACQNSRSQPQTLILSGTSVVVSDRTRSRQAYVILQWLITRKCRRHWLAPQRRPNWRRPRVIRIASRTGRTLTLSRSRGFFGRVNVREISWRETFRASGWRS